MYRMIVIALCLFPCVGFQKVGTAASAEEIRPSYRSQSEYEVHGHTLSIPVGKILLVKTATGMCAVQLPGTPDEKSFEKFDPARSFYRWSQDYVSSYQAGHLPTFDSERTVVTAGVASWIMFSVFDTLVWQHGSPYVQCGDVALAWNFPRWISFRDAKRHQTLTEVAFAPTGWSMLEEVDAANPRIRWFFYDEGRAELRILLGDLPRGKN